MPQARLRRGAGTGCRGNSAHPAPILSSVLGFPAKTSWAPEPPAHGSRITSPLRLLGYIFTLFFDYCSLFCAVIVDTDQIIARVSVSHCALSPGLGFAVFTSSLLSINIFSWRPLHGTFVVPAYVGLLLSLWLSRLIFP